MHLRLSFAGCVRVSVTVSSQGKGRQVGRSVPDGDRSSKQHASDCRPARSGKRGNSFPGRPSGQGSVSGNHGLCHDRSNQVRYTPNVPAAPPVAVCTNPGRMASNSFMLRVCVASVLLDARAELDAQLLGIDAHGQIIRHHAVGRRINVQSCSSLIPYFLLISSYTG